jgi:hypothetical protein
VKFGILKNPPATNNLIFIFKGNKNILISQKNMKKPLHPIKNKNNK